jgi:hypothetical protein
MEVSGQLHTPTGLLPGDSPSGTHWIGNWVGPSVGLDNVEKKKFLTLAGLELRPLGSPARLRYPGGMKYHVIIYYFSAGCDQLKFYRIRSKIWNQKFLVVEYVSAILT